MKQARPTLDTWVEEGVPHGEARWQAGNEVIELLRHGRAAALHEGGEEVVERLRVCVSGLPGATKLLLVGPLGQLCRFAVVGGRAAAAVRAAWRAVL